MLFSEPKIPQCGVCIRDSLSLVSVSVLFSEPKIPQSIRARVEGLRPNGFSALQRAENSSISLDCCDARARRGVSVLFSEPKIPQCGVGV